MAGTTGSRPPMRCPPDGGREGRSSERKFCPSRLTLSRFGGRGGLVRIVRGRCVVLLPGITLPRRLGCGLGCLCVCVCGVCACVCVCRFWRLGKILRRLLRRRWVRRFFIESLLENRGQFGVVQEADCFCHGGDCGGLPECACWGFIHAFGWAARGPWCCGSGLGSTRVAWAPHNARMRMRAWFPPSGRLRYGRQVPFWGIARKMCNAGGLPAGTTRVPMRYPPKKCAAQDTPFVPRQSANARRVQRIVPHRGPSSTR